MTTTGRYDGPRGKAAIVLVMLLRAILLWVVVPVTAFAWLAMLPLMRARGVGIGQMLGWADLNLVAALEHSVLRPLQPSPYPFVAWRALPSVAHRIGTPDAG